MPQMGYDTKTDRLTDCQSQCDSDSDSEGFWRKGVFGQTPNWVVWCKSEEAREWNTQCSSETRDTAKFFLHLSSIPVPVPTQPVSLR
jgi:hypothetical protein